MKLRTNYTVVLAAIIVSMFAIGCNSDDNRVLEPAEAKKAQQNNIAEIEKLNIPEASKKELESHMGGAPYSNPAMEAAKSHGVKVAPGGRTQ